MYNIIQNCGKKIEINFPCTGKDLAHYQFEEWQDFIIFGLISRNCHCVSVQR